MPFPPGWEDAGPRTPEWAWGAMVFTDPAAANDPPTIIALMSKLTGNVDPAKILEFAPGELKNLPRYEGEGNGSASTLGGFDAWQMGGSYMKDGTKRMIAQTDGLEDQIGPLMDATKVINDQTTITP